MLGKKWQARWTALVPNGILVFADAKKPKVGAQAKQVIPVEHATLEGVAEDEAKRKFAFCVGKAGQVRVCDRCRQQILCLCQCGCP